MVWTPLGVGIWFLSFLSFLSSFFFFRTGWYPQVYNSHFCSFFLFNRVHFPTCSHNRHKVYLQRRCLSGKAAGSLKRGLKNNGPSKACRQMNPHPIQTASCPRTLWTYSDYGSPCLLKLLLPSLELCKMTIFHFMSCHTWKQMSLSVFIFAFLCYR